MYRRGKDEKEVMEIEKRKSELDGREDGRFYEVMEGGRREGEGRQGRERKAIL